MTREQAKEFICSMEGQTHFTKQEIVKYKQALRVLAGQWVQNVG